MAAPGSRIIVLPIPGCDPSGTQFFKEENHNGTALKEDPPPHTMKQKIIYYVL